jgi:hypothetical protein
MSCDSPGHHPRATTNTPSVASITAYRRRRFIRALDKLLVVHGADRRPESYADYGMALGYLEREAAGRWAA